MRLKYYKQFSLALALIFTGVSVVMGANLLALIPTGENFMRALEGMKSELGSKYAIKTIDVNANPDPLVLAQKLRLDTIVGLIMMDSKALWLYQKVQKVDTTVSSLPKFVLMTLQAGSSTRDIPNVAGILFEVPGYTMITNFRALSVKDVTKVAVFYRNLFAEDIEKDKRLLAKERIELVSVCLDCGMQKPMTVVEAIQKMQSVYKGQLSSAKIDAYWVLADNLVVNGKALGEFWLAKPKADKKPIVGTVETLASTKIGAAVFTADPDYTQLGVQSAGQILQVLEEGEDPKNLGFEPLISVKTVLNLTTAKAIGWKIREDRMSRVSKAIK